jgi:hypothetical protein
MAVYRGPDWVSRAGKSKEADVSVGLGTGSVDGTAAVSFEGCSESTDLLKNNLGRGSPRIEGRPRNGRSPGMVPFLAWLLELSNGFRYPFRRA